jgi:DnaJ-class molecular chaperone
MKRAYKGMFTSGVLAILWIAPAYGQDDVCLECHAESDFTSVDEAGNEISLFVDATLFAGSIHGEFGCVDCHVDVDMEVHPDGRLAEVDCNMCHDDIAEEYHKSIHFAGAERGDQDVATCADCHGTHNILPASDPAARHHPLNIAKTCARCHADPQITKAHDITIPNPLQAYQNSVHGVAVLSESNFDAATCVSCHGSHDVRAMGDSESPINWQHVPETCGQCHGEIMAQYEESIHWRAAKKGIRNSPVCTDCHGEHAVRRHDDPASPVHPLRVSSQTCERCHGSELLSSKYGLALSRTETFEQSYHGLAIKGGSLAAANCASCHGIHNILPSSNPRSLTYPANLSKTCGKCHANAKADFARGPVHITSTTTPGRVVHYVKTVYLWLIIVVIGGMLVHNGIDFVRKSRNRLAQRLES